MILKLEKDGSCQTIVLDDILTKPNSLMDLRGFDQSMLIAMCIAAGCDYLVLNN